MSAGLDARPSATTLDLEDLVSQAWSGKIRVPHFQRSFRWNRHDVLRLFDSIVKGYPIGSLLLWFRPAVAQTLKLGALRIEAPTTDEAHWVVDGQQRIISLANALHEDGSADAKFALAYDLRADRFVPRPAADEPTVVPLPVIFDLHEVLNWFATYPEAREYLGLATAITKTLRQYSVPAYQVVQEDEHVLQDIFDRMNNYGKRLSRSEIFSALNAGTEGKQGLTFDLIAANLDTEYGFGVIDDDTILKAVLGRRGPDVMREIRNEFGEQSGTPGAAELERRAVIEFPHEDRDTAYQAGEAALSRAVAFLQNDAGVPHVSMLAYKYLLVVLARLFAHHPDPDSRNRRLLRRWYWRAAVAGPEFFKGSTTGAIRALCNKVRPSDLSGSVQGLLDAVARSEPPALPNLRRFRGNEASTKITLCAWWAREPRSLGRDGSFGRRFERDELSVCLVDRPTAGDAVRYIVPRMLVPHQYRLWAADRVLLPVVEDDVVEVAGLVIQRPLDVDDETWWTALRSHAMTPDLVDLLVHDKTVEFLEARQELLQADLEAFLKRMCEWGFENTPPLSDLVIDDLDGQDDESR